jgi:hypothetical protein
VPPEQQLFDGVTGIYVAAYIAHESPEAVHIRGAQVGDGIFHPIVNAWWSIGEIERIGESRACASVG